MKRTVLRVTYCALFAIACMAMACGGGSDKPSSNSSNEAPSAGATAGLPPSKVKFEQLGVLADSLAPGAKTDPDAAKFATSVVEKSSPNIWYKLSDDNDAPSHSAWVDVDVKQNGTVIQHQRQIANLGAWRFVTLYWDYGCTGGACRAAFPPGDYDIEAKLLGTSEKRMLKFTITPEGGKTPAPVKLDNAGIAPAIVNGNPAATFVTSIRADALPRVAYHVTFGDTPGWVTATWSSKSKQIGDVQTNLIVPEQANKPDFWSWFTMPANKYEAGEYNVDLLVTATGEKRSLKFNVEAGPAQAARLLEVHTAPQLTSKGATPVANIFASKFDGWDTIYPVFLLQGDLGTREYAGVQWKYNGTVVREDWIPGSLLKDSTTLGWAAPTNPALTSRPDLRTGFPVPLPAGDYEATVTLLPSGESKATKFMVTKVIGATPTPAPTRAPAAAPGTPSAR